MTSFDHKFTEGLSYTSWLSLGTKEPLSFAKQFFNALDLSTMDLVDDFYAPEAVLVDPLGENIGRENVKAYYDSMYQPVTAIHFDFPKSHVVDKNVYLSWMMTFKSTKLNGGEDIVVDGLSHMIFNDAGKVTWHRDYFDMGAMVYEEVPLFGRVVKWLKGKLKH